MSTSQDPKPALDPEPTTISSANNTNFVFTQLMAMINNEGVVMWSRYNAMLTGNTIVGVLLGALVATDLCIEA
jgi:hypothetical protein